MAGVPPGFENDPIMFYGGSLKANKLYWDYGIRLSTSNQADPGLDADNEYVYGIGVGSNLFAGCSVSGDNDYRDFLVKDYSPASSRNLVDYKPDRRAEANIAKHFQAAQGTDHGAWFSDSPYTGS